jgi:hypothetical protein
MIIDLLKPFTEVKFNDIDHSYKHLDGRKLTSVTTVIHEYETPFDEERWLPIKAQEYCIEEYQLKYSWTWLNDHSKFKGSAIHNYIENYFLNKIYEYPSNEIVNFFGYDPIVSSYDHIINKQFNKFYELSVGKLIPVRPEMIVYDLDYNISGMIDMIFYNLKEQKLQVWDWKTNKELKLYNKYQKMKGPLSHLDQCEINTYSLQLHTYKHLLEKNTGLKFSDDCYIVWFFEKNPSFSIIKTHDMTNEVQLMINDFCLK